MWLTVLTALVMEQAKPLAPDRGLVMALGGAGNVRAANALEDADGIIRRMPLGFRTQNGYELSFPADERGTE